MRPTAALLLAVTALAGCNGDTPAPPLEPQPRGKPARETDSRARRRVRDSELPPRLKHELQQAQDQLDIAPKD